MRIDHKARTGNVREANVLKNILFYKIDRNNVQLIPSPSPPVEVSESSKVTFLRAEFPSDIEIHIIFRLCSLLPICPLNYAIFSFCRRSRHQLSPALRLSHNRYFFILHGYPLFRTSVCKSETLNKSFPFCTCSNVGTSSLSISVPALTSCMFHFFRVRLTTLKRVSRSFEVG